MDNNYEDDYLKRVFRSKLKDFEPEEDTIEWQPITVKSYSKTRTIITIASFILLFSIGIIPVVQHTQNQATPEKSNENYRLLNDYAHTELPCIPPGSNDSTNISIPASKFVKKNAATQPKSATQNKVLEEFNRSIISRDSLSFVISNQPSDFGTLRSGVFVDSMHDDSVAISPIQIDSILMASIIPINLSDSLSTQRKSKRSGLFTLSIGLFINSNRFVPTKGDGHLIQSFDQDKNIFKNRLGVEVSVSGKTLNTPFIKIRPALKYMFLHKSFTFERQSIQSETTDDFVTIKESNGYHFTGLGIVLLPKKMIFGKPLQLEGTFLMSLNDSGYSFAQRNLELGASTNMRLKYREDKIFNLEPFIKYTMPLDKHGLFSTNMFILGFRTTIYDKNH